jgi:hypothetical protein
MTPARWLTLISLSVVALVSLENCVREPDPWVEPFQDVPGPVCESPHADLCPGCGYVENLGVEPKVRRTK